jgi:DeoR family transcriptional regulator of aga operon
MLKQSKEAIVVADPSKLGQVSPAFICAANEIHMLITSTTASDESVAPFQQLGIRILRV